MDLKLEGKRALVTGDSRGLGYATALGLGREGAHVAINSRDETRIAAAAQKMTETLRLQAGATIHRIIPLLRRVDAGADDWVAAQVRRGAEEIGLPGRVRGPGPLDLRGTAFQWRVWRALIAIPPGTTRSYTDIAEAIGEPTAVRAVARACGANRVAVIVPCHRVVRSDGTLGGYRWGLPRKAELIRRESATA